MRRRSKRREMVDLGRGKERGGGGGGFGGEGCKKQQTKRRRIGCLRLYQVKGKPAFNLRCRRKTTYGESRHSVATCSRRHGLMTLRIAMIRGATWQEILNPQLD